MLEVMLQHVNKLCSILLLIIITASCRWELSSEQLRQMRENAYQVSVNTIGYDDYWSIYDAMNDSIKVWIDNELGLYKYYNRTAEEYGVKYQIDSLLCFNEQRNMCLTSVLRQMQGQTSNSDGIWYFFGIRIKGQWYFFGGAEMILPRDFYQKEDYPPLSFEKLKELAMEHLYQGYARKSKEGEWYINDAFFNRYYEYDAYNSKVTSKAARDSSWLKACRENWSERNKR